MIAVPVFPMRSQFHDVPYRLGRSDREFCPFVNIPFSKKSHMLHVWYIYLQSWVIFRANVGKYSIHGAYGSDQSMRYGHTKPAGFQVVSGAGKTVIPKLTQSGWWYTYPSETY